MLTKASWGGVICLISVLITALSCQSTSLDDVSEDTAGKKVMHFNVKGYTITNFESTTDVASSQTKAASTTDVTDNLLLGVFDKDGNMVGEPTIQAKGDEDYGTFSYTLNYGRYTILAIGWNGTMTCNVNSLNNISFSEQWVPHAFMSRQNIVVSESYSDTRTITMGRCVARFEIGFNDAPNYPTNLSKFVVSISGAGNTLNSEDGHCAAIQNYTRELAINNPSTLKNIAVYCFLPAEESLVTLNVDAQDSEGNSITSRTFTDVTMKINHITRYTGYFFSASATDNIIFNNEYSGTMEETF